MATIVVGVDGSSSARAALRFAAQEAKLRKASLRVVTAYMTTMDYGGGPFASNFDPRVFEESASALLDECLEDLGDEATGIEIERAIRMGQPARVLVEEAKGAELLIVGSRGHGGFVGLLLGSVSHQCALHARCPVVIVREKERTD